MEELLSCREEGWDFGGHGQRRVARKGLNIRSRPVEVVSKDRDGQIGGHQWHQGSQRAEREELALAETQEAVALLTGSSLGCSISVPRGPLWGGRGLF